VKKYVKVSKNLRQKINTVLDGKNVSGTARLVMLGCYADNRPSDSISQAVYPLPLPRVSPRGTGVLFGWDQIMYIASRLFNGRPETGTDLINNALSNTFVENSTSSTGWSNFSNGVYTEQEISAFKVEVTNLKARITIRNNSKVAQHLCMYVCKPKTQWNDSEETGTGKAIRDWNAALGSDNGAQVEGRIGNGLNLPINLNVQTNTLHATPKIAKSFAKRWSYDAFKIDLEPGQEHTHWVQGDEKVYDFAKMYKKKEAASGVDFCNVQPSDRHIFFTGHPKLTTLLEGGQAFSVYGNQADGYGLNFYTEIYAQIKMPETTG
jgi:hypothetical protein